MVSYTYIWTWGILKGSNGFHYIPQPIPIQTMGYRAIEG
jgi:hypothetical protein